MLAITFKAAGNRYALPVLRVEEVTPLVSLAPLPGAPDYIRGVMNHRGTPLPVADLNVLLAGKPSRELASTRIMVARAAGDALLGLMAERVLKTVDVDPGDILPPAAPAAPYVQGAAIMQREPVHLIDVERVLPAELLRTLSQAALAAREAT